MGHGHAHEDHGHGHGSHGHEHGSSSGAWRWLHDSKARKLALMICLTGMFMVVEIGFGIYARSLALISDGFHMFSDVVGLAVGVTARTFSWKDRTHKMSYGFRRAETVGAFANGVFLLAICLFIILDAIQRFIDPEDIQSPLAVVIVGGIGLAINIGGLFLFHGHGHSHGGHGHGHGHENKSHDETSSAALSSSPIVLGDTTSATAELASDPSIQLDEVIEQARTGFPQSIEIADTGVDDHAHGRTADLNLHGVFLHVAGDALGSVGVLISGLISMYVEASWTRYVDSIVSVLISLIILSSCVPLVKKAGRILLQGTPKHIDLASVGRALAKIAGVRSVHELHCWLLADNTAIASVHIKCVPSADVMALVRDTKGVLHAYGIHSATIQPELTDPSSIDEACEVDCAPTCGVYQCCPPEQTLRRRIVSTTTAVSDV
eukprot:m.223568 g.223568  ORF g.223568 m.223568 type:complete len:435 (+) comp10943_c0_seq1:29-1333(+)